MASARHVVIATVCITIASLQSLAGQGIRKGLAADKEIDRLLGKGTAAALNKVDRTCESLTTFVRLFLSHTDAGNYTDAYKLMTKDANGTSSASALGAYVESNPAFSQLHKRPEMFDCALDPTERGGNITVPITTNTGDRFTIRFEVIDQVNRLSVRRIFTGRTFP